MTKVYRSILVVGFLLGWFPAPLQAQTPRKPNILIIVGDDLGYADVGVQGCKDIPTPHIDSLAKNGIRCTSGYVSGAYCSPTRAALMTGRYQARFGHEFNPGLGKKFENEGLPVKETTIANRLRALGYATGMVGKWHLGTGAKLHPMERGFQQFFGFLEGKHTYFPGKGATILRGQDNAMEKTYLTDAFGREALAFIDQHKTEPFFLYLAFNAVHMPLEATEQYLKRFPNIKNEKRRTYAAMMSAMDDAIGTVLAKLREAGIEEDTLIFFISDNGGPPQTGSSNFPLRGIKATTWEGGIRVPFLVQWKGRLPAGKTYDHPVIQLDFLPTAVAAAGGELKPDMKLDGVNLLPYLEGKKEEAPHSALFWRFGKQTAVRMGDWNLVEAHGSKGKHLFNLREDIGQTKDLSAAHPERVRELQAAWDEWNKGNVPPAWKMNAQEAKNLKE